MAEAHAQRPGNGWRPVDFDNLKTMTYEVTGRVARITFNRPEKGNAIVADTPLELSALVERADLDERARHTPEGHAFVADAGQHGFREAVRHRDEPFGDHGRTTSGV